MFGSYPKIFYTCFLAIVVRANSQIYNPYGQYGYTPFNQFFPRQEAVYNPYQYQPYVSQQLPYNNYNPYYGYRAQSYGPQNYYPTYNYPTQRNHPAVYTPYPYINYSPNVNINNSPSRNSTFDSTQSEEDPYANVKVDIIDVDPKDFIYYKKFFNLEDNSYPIEVTDGSSITGASGYTQTQSQNQPYYTVKTGSKSYNFSSVPQNVNVHETKTKTYSFKKTFTLDPNHKGSQVINLNFANGVQVTTEEPTVADQEFTTAVSEGQTEEATSYATTTENEEPEDLFSWK